MLSKTALIALIECLKPQIQSTYSRTNGSWEYYVKENIAFTEIIFFTVPENTQFSNLVVGKQIVLIAISSRKTLR